MGGIKFKKTWLTSGNAFIVDLFALGSIKELKYDKKIPSDAPHEDRPVP